MASAATGKILRDQFVDGIVRTDLWLKVAPHPLSDRAVNLRFDFPSALFAEVPADAGDYVSLHFTSPDFDDHFYYTNIPAHAPDSDTHGVRRVMLMAQFKDVPANKLLVRVLIGGKAYGDFLVRLHSMNRSGQCHVIRDFVGKVCKEDTSPLLAEISAGQVPDEAPTSGRYCYLSGTQKSGTTWLENIMNLDPTSLVLHEANTASFFDPGQCGETAFRNSEELHYVPWYPHHIDMPSFGDTLRAAMSKYVLEYYRNLWGAELVGDRTPGVTRFLDGILRSWEHPRVVHIVRNPLDVAVSWVFHELNFFRKAKLGQIPARYAEELCARLFDDGQGKGKGKQKGRGKGAGTMIGTNLVKDGVFNWILDQWNTDQQMALRLNEQYPDRFLIVNYEDLLADPAAGIERLYAFMGYQLSDKQLADFSERANFKRFSGGRSAGEKDGTSFFRSGTAGDYVNYFSEETQQLLVARCGELASRFGYQFALQPLDANISK